MSIHKIKKSIKKLFNDNLSYFYKNNYYKYNILSKRNMIVLISGFILLILYLLVGKNSVIKDDYYIYRNELGQPDKNITLYANNDSLDNLEINFKINSKRLNKEEADIEFEKLYEFILIDSLGDNQDFEHINKNLNFKSNYNSINAHFSFEPISEDNYVEYYNKYNKVVDSLGNVNNKLFIDNEKVNGNIIIQFNTTINGSYTEYKSKKYIIPIVVIKPELDIKNDIKNTLLSEIENENYKSENEDKIKLPEIIKDYSLSYTEKFDWNVIFIPIFTLLLIFILNYNDKFKEKEQKQINQRKPELDYPQIITKSLIYINSGMTIRNSLINIANNYILKLKNNNTEKRQAYEELIVFKNKINNGYNEILALEEMSKNINDRNYTRFLNILIQGIKNGSKDLKNILNLEVSDALFNRKMTAKRLGEEASTKLILPLLMMFFIILVVIVVPAFTNM